MSAGGPPGALGVHRDHRIDAGDAPRPPDRSPARRNIQGLHSDNSCAGCHTPAFGFGDSQSIAIGVDNNTLVGPDRAGPRNQRKAPPVINSAFFPKQMLNGRFVALSGDPFDNSLGFQFPPPEGTTKFPPEDPQIRTLLAAQGHIPQTELVEMAGFTGTLGTVGADFDQFDDGHGPGVRGPRRVRARPGARSAGEA